MSGPASGAVAGTIPLGRLWWAAILLLGISAGAVGWTVWQLRNTPSAPPSRIPATSRRFWPANCRVPSNPSTTCCRRSTTQPKIWISIVPWISAPPQIANALYKSLVQQRNRLPQVFNVAIADEHGQVWFHRGLACSERQCFRPRLFQ